MAKRPWQKKEDKDSSILGAKKTVRSGGIWFMPGDSKSDQFLIDSKDSKHDRFSIPRKMWKKIAKEALMNQRIPILSIGFGEQERVELVVLDRNDFITLLDDTKASSN